MSQQIWNEIIPTTTSGNQLATLLNGFKDAVVSGFSGTSRPSQLDAGGYWIDTTDDASGLWYYKLYTGTQDITVFTINKDTGSASVFSTDSQFQITKSSVDTDGGILKFLKERGDGGQTLDGDSLGDIEFTGTRDDGVEVIQSRISAVSSDDVTATARGSYLVIEGTDDNTSALTEMARIIDSKLGIGVTNPEETIHIDGNFKGLNESDTIAPVKSIYQKKRIAGGGQVLSGDSLYKSEVYSTDSNGDSFEASNVEHSASENHTDIARGTQVVFRNTNAGETALSAYMTVGDSVAFNKGVDVADMTVSGTVTNGTFSNSSVENPSRLDPKKDTEANLTTYASSAQDGELVYSSDTNSFFVITGGELVPAGGGGGGTSLIWEKNSSVAPIADYVEGIRVEGFDAESEQEIYALVPVPLSYRAGKQITLKEGIYATSATSGNVFFSAASKLITSGSTVLGSLGTAHDSINTENTVPAISNELQAIGDVDLTDTSGEINGTAVAPGDKILVRLYRNNSGETSSANAITNLIINSFEIAFS
jgi:hypothetical protein